MYEYTLCCGFIGHVNSLSRVTFSLSMSIMDKFSKVLASSIFIIEKDLCFLILFSLFYSCSLLL